MSANPGGLPPRHALSRDVTVPVLPGLGRTWYDRRGAGYWARRAALSILWLFLTALVTLIVVAILIALWRRSTAFTVVLVLEIVYSLGILAFLAVATVRGWNDPHPEHDPARERPGPDLPDPQLADHRPVPGPAGDLTAAGNPGRAACEAGGSCATARPRPGRLLMPPILAPS